MRTRERPRSGFHLGLELATPLYTVGEFHPPSHQQSNLGIDFGFSEDGTDQRRYFSTNRRNLRDPASSVTVHHSLRRPARQVHPFVKNQVRFPDIISFCQHQLLAILPVAEFSLAVMLEEALVGFVPLDGATRIHDASIVYAAEDPVGVHIAINNLATDLEHITGKAPPTAAFGKDSGDGSSLFGSEPPKSVIIAGTVKSALIEKHINDGQLTVTEVVGRWETFKTAVVRDPFPGVESGLVIAGSDKRAVIFGIYTLTQQCGQSP